MHMTLVPLALAVLSTPSFAAGAPPAPTSTRVTEPFRQEHVEIQEHLSHIDAMAGSLAQAKPAAARKTMGEVVAFLNRHIRAHAEWEEKHLYPAVDRRTTAGPHPFTESMRYEHRIVGRGIDELAGLSKGEAPDPVAFTRRTDALLGLIRAHFEEEEQVLLPILDQAMTPEQFRQEIGAVGH